MTTLAELSAQTEAARTAALRGRDAAVRAIHAVLDAAKQNNRTRLTPTEDVEVERLLAQRASAIEAANKAATALEEIETVLTEDAETDRQMSTRAASPANTATRPGTRTGDGPRWVRTNDLRPAVVARGTRFADHEIVQEQSRSQATADQAVIGHHGSLGHMLRSMSTTSGSAVVPTVWLGDIIDRARNIAAVLKAGAEIVPMDAKTVQIGRLTGDPTAAFRTEGSTVTASDPVFDNVTLDSKTMSALVIGSLEWFQDSPNVDAVVMEAIAQAIALELDRQALFGGLTTGGEVGATGFNTTFPTPPNPRGVLPALLAVAASSVLGSGANGTAQTAATYYAELLDLLYQPKYFNETPNAIIGNAKLWRQYAGAADTTNQPLRMPADLEQIDRLVSNQIPSFTAGTMTTRATDVFVGDWTQLLIGQRLDMVIQTLTERYAELGQIGIIAHWRGDVQPARPRAFAVYRYLQAAV